MPIRPDRMALYPGGGTHSPEWRAFRAELLIRADNRCEGTPQHPDCRAENGEPHPETGSKVVLTIAHMDWDESHADPARCRALCQRCHLQWDAGHHAKNAALTRRQKSGQLDIEDWLAASVRGISLLDRDPLEPGNGNGILMPMTRDELAGIAARAGGLKALARALDIADRTMRRFLSVVDPKPIPEDVAQRARALDEEQAA